MKMHVAINVRDFNTVLDFYKKLFNAEPTKVRSNYAKFESADEGLRPSSVCCPTPPAELITLD